MTSSPRTCRVCGCTDDDCSECYDRTGQPCHWVEPDLCSACQFWTALKSDVPTPCRAPWGRKLRRPETARRPHRNGGRP